MADLIARASEQRVRIGLRESRAVCIVGPRQSGKSTLAKVIADSGFTDRLITLDDADTLRAASVDPTGFVANIDGPVVIDEVQRVPQLLLALKMRMDANDANGQFLLTGSANIQTLPTIQDALPGRVNYVPLWTLAQQEIEATSPTLLARAFTGDVPDIHGAGVGIRHHAERLARGGYPRAFLLSHRSRVEYFRNYVDSLIGRDMLALRSIRSQTDVHQLLRVLATRSGGLLNFAALATRLGINAGTAKAYLDLFEDLMLVRRVRAWHANLGKRETQTPKLHVSDSGLLAYLLGADVDRITNDDSVSGPLLESFVAMEVIRQVEWLTDVVEVYHYRDKDKREVDLVLERTDGAVVAIEVKSTASVRGTDFRGLQFLRDKLGDRFAAGIVLHTGGQALPAGDRLWSVPLSALWCDS